MSTKMTLQVNSNSSDQTEQIAENLGQQLKGGEVIELISDLGGGKTTFTRGLVRGMGSTDHVSSPTFKICNVYKSSNLEIHHFDFYRLNDPGLIKHELSDVLGDNKIITIIEWADVVKKQIPNDALMVNIKRVDEDSRVITFHYSDNLAYLFS